MKNKTDGFSLIEVLVVVLIIGILTSVALPQYRKAVVKARVMKLLPLMRTIDSAQQVYYSTYMRYAAKFDDLDIAMPAGGSVNTASTVIHYNDFYCYLYLDEGVAYSVYCNSKDPIAPRIEKYFDRDWFICWFYSDSGSGRYSDNEKEKICSSIAGGKNKAGYRYTFQ